MNDSHYAIKQFSSLHRDEKKKSLLQLLDVFAGKHPTFTRYHDIVTQQDVDDDFLIATYTTLVNGIHELSQTHIVAMADKLENIKHVVADIRQQEAEVAKNDNPDDLLRHL